MKQFITVIALIGVLFSCKNTGENKKEDQSAVAETVGDGTTDEVKTNYVPIDSDEALIAASLMAFLILHFIILP